VAFADTTQKDYIGSTAPDIQLQVFPLIIPPAVKQRAGNRKPVSSKSACKPHVVAPICKTFIEDV